MAASTSFLQAYTLINKQNEYVSAFVRTALRVCTCCLNAVNKHGDY